MKKSSFAFGFASQEGAMKQFETTIDLVGDWQQRTYRWFVSNCGQKWKLVDKKNENLAEVVAKNDFSMVSESDRNSLLAYYYNLFHRIVSPRERKLRVPDAVALFATVPEDMLTELKAGWVVFVQDVTDGRNLEQRQTEKRFEIDSKDVLLDRFRIHHFHLSVKPEKPSCPVLRRPSCRKTWDASMILMSLEITNEFT